MEADILELAAAHVLVTEQIETVELVDSIANVLNKRRLVLRASSSYPSASRQLAKHKQQQHIVSVCLDCPAIAEATVFGSLWLSYLLSIFWTLAFFGRVFEYKDNALDW